MLLSAILFIGWYCIIPDIGKLRTSNPIHTSFMKYRDIQWQRQGIQRKVIIRWVPLNRISPSLITAVIASEDGKFYKHHGFDLAAMRSAAQENYRAGKFRFGASTISQQLVKNLYLKPSKNLMRKATEAILTWRLERTLPKKRILEIYLNVIEWGDGIFGIESAAHHYYGKSASELDDSESSHLAAVIPSPLRLDPLSGSSYIETRAAVILRRMHQNRKNNTDNAIPVPDTLLINTQTDSIQPVNNITDSIATQSPVPVPGNIPLPPVQP